MPTFKNNHPNYYNTKDGIRLFYNTNFEPTDLDSDKTVLLFNYGLVCNNAHWKDQIAHFDNTDVPIIIHNFRGHFNSSSPENIEDCTIEFMAKDCVELLEHIGAKNVVALGHSMGVNVTLELATMFPLQGMVLISGSVLPPHEVMFDSNLIELVAPYWKLFSEKFPTAYQKIWSTSYLNPIINKVVHSGGFNTDRVSNEFVQLYLKRMGELSPDIFLQLIENMRQHTIISRLETIKTKTLLMGGDKDSIIPNYLQKMLHKFLPNSELYIIKDGSHVPQVDFPETINERIELFLHTNS